MNAARRGAHFERRVRRLLEAEGWYVVRMAGSRGVADLLALRPAGTSAEARFVQVKVRKHALGPKAREELAKVAWYAGGTPWLVYRGPAARRYAVILEALPAFAERGEGAEA
jgi:Holliday junction resolvase